MEIDFVKTRIKQCVLLFFLIVGLTLSGCKDSEKQQLTGEQTAQIHGFVTDLNESFQSFDYNFLEKAWSHTLFKKEMGDLDYIGRSVFDHIYETRIKSLVNNRNFRLINEVRHSGAVLKHISTNVVKDFAEVTYLLIEKNSYSFTKYKVDFFQDKPYLTDIYGFRENRWYSEAMIDDVLLNVKYDAYSKNRHEANQALGAYQIAMEAGEYAYALELLNQVPKSHRNFNDYKLARVMLGAQLSDSILSFTISELKKGDSNIYLDYWIALYRNDSLDKKDILVRMHKEIGIPQSLVDSLESIQLPWK